MKKFISIVISIIILLVPVNIIKANDSNVGRLGETVFPMTEENVEMVSEDIHIYVDETRSSGIVSCEFVFRNLGDERNILMGFPATLDISNDSLANEEQVTLKNFTAKLNGSDIEVKMIEGSTLIGDYSKYPYWYVFEVPFKKNETLTLSHTYDVYFSNDSMGGMMVGYILETGLTWKNNIGHSTITFDLKNLNPWGILSQFTNAPIEKFSYRDGLLTFENYDFSPEYNIEIYTDRRFSKSATDGFEGDDDMKITKDFFNKAQTQTIEELTRSFNELKYGGIHKVKFIEQVYYNTRVADSKIVNPKTGDNTVLYFCLVCIFTFVFTLLLLKRKVCINK